jgi:hypothetical protein
MTTAGGLAGPLDIVGDTNAPTCEDGVCEIPAPAGDQDISRS